MQKTLPTSMAVLLALIGVPAKAMPFGSLPAAPPEVISVGMGCGPGWARRPYGHGHLTSGSYYGYGRYRHQHFHGYYYSADLPTLDRERLWNDP